MLSTSPKTGFKDKLLLFMKAFSYAVFYLVVKYKGKILDLIRFLLFHFSFNVKIPTEYLEVSGCDTTKCERWSSLNIFGSAFVSNFLQNKEKCGTFKSYKVNSDSSDFNKADPEQWLILII